MGFYLLGVFSSKDTDPVVQFKNGILFTKLETSPLLSSKF